MNERFSPLPGATTWFRLAERGATFLPQDAVLPVDTWLRPTSSDVREGRARGRPAGLSVWDRGGTTVEQAGLLWSRSANQRVCVCSRTAVWLRTW